MFVAHWLIYHIDQHISHLVCDFEKDDVRCQYLTDLEADMKQHVSKVHNAKFNALIATNRYVEENAWLEWTSSWSIKYIHKDYKLTQTGSTALPYIWVIMDHHAKYPRSKTNTFQVTRYSSEE